ncbi:MAG: DEAD/DEAH box helicase [Rubripirellula sp.]
MKTFSELDLIQPLQDAIADQGYETPTPIQARTITPAIAGRDVLGCAQTGTGKTAAFSLPILNRLGQSNRKAKPGRPFVLVLAPTRELAIQIDESLNTYGAKLRLRTALVYGGVGQAKQVRQLQRGAHVLVATPGRLLDLMDQGYITLERLEMFVLDEADRMLDMGFLPDLKRIIRELPEDRQSLFFSATVPDSIVDLANSLLHDPVRVSLAPKRPAVEKIDQQMMFIGRSHKSDLLTRVLSDPDVHRAVVFTRTKRGADAVARRLDKQGIRSVAIHGNKSQNARQRSLDAFRRNRYQVLVATDVAARGIDIDGVTHVVNYDLPDEPESYVHRIGRTARAGAEGIAISFCSETEVQSLRAIEKFMGTGVPVHEDYPPNELHRTADPNARKGRRGGSGGSRNAGKSRGGQRSTSRSKQPRSKQPRVEAKSTQSHRTKSARSGEATGERAANSGRAERAERVERPARPKDGQHKKQRSKSDAREERGATERTSEGSKRSKAGGRVTAKRGGDNTAEKGKRRKSRKQREDRVDFKRGPGAKKKRKVKGSTSNNRTEPKPISKSGKKDAKKGKPIAKGRKPKSKTQGAGKKSGRKPVTASSKRGKA